MVYIGVGDFGLRMATARTSRAQRWMTRSWLSVSFNLTRVLVVALALPGNRNRGQTQ